MNRTMLSCGHFNESLPNNELGIGENMSDVLLQVQDLSKRFRSNYGDLWAVRDVSFDLLRGQRLVITGLSG